MDLGSSVKFFRVKRGLTQYQLADSAELSTSYISLLERNRRDASLSVLETIANALNIPLVFLVAYAELDKLDGILDTDLRDKLSYTILRS